MVYAIVTEYTDGHTAVQFIDNKAPAASKTRSFIQRFIEKGVLYMCYAAEYHPERKHHIFEDVALEIPLDGVRAVTIHNVDGENIDPVSPFIPAYPLI